MAEEDIGKFNANFNNFIADIGLILKSQGTGEGLDTVINLLSMENAAAQMMGTTRDIKIKWFSNMLEKEFDIPSSCKKAKLRDIHYYENYNLFFSIMLSEAKSLINVSIPTLTYDSLDSDDKELIQAYINSFVNICNSFVGKEKVN